MEMGRRSIQEAVSKSINRAMDGPFQVPTEKLEINEREQNIAFMRHFLPLGALNQSQQQMATSRIHPRTL